MLLDLIYPPVCGICDKINKKYLCKKCEISIKPYLIYKIEKSENRYFDYQIKVLKYRDIIRQKIIDYKFNEKAYLHQTFAKIILNNEKIYSFLEKYDIMLCVPMYIKKRRLRGYNQSELIAIELAKNLNLELQLNNLVKIKDTRKQSTLTKTERKTNLKNAFKIKKIDKIKGKNVILFDDIFTTGSTADECSKVIKQAGANSVAVLTVATD